MGGAGAAVGAIVGTGVVVAATVGAGVGTVAIGAPEGAASRGLDVIADGAQALSTSISSAASPSRFMQITTGSRYARDGMSWLAYGLVTS
jgi:hypothetical protein